ncbi:hypothetical protein [Aureibacter tunicatorum]|uniref:Uncharacterized protein n=1 Tax=Aureibacter tunicatorum TaxID=866807 RepID=A0AAE4BUB0_9BACT|nr:hypothetical protein [Aureibacter tunicatorum]MDR6240537.1 hypothetical protein [Aureibacter tunicatorum]BDD06602.1 hypothetical protein AUTU_40850 [Aureibacter tunicatorum]
MYDTLSFNNLSTKRTQTRQSGKTLLPADSSIFSSFEAPVQCMMNDVYFRQNSWEPNSEERVYRYYNYPELLEIEKLLRRFSYLADLHSGNFKPERDGQTIMPNWPNEMDEIYRVLFSLEKQLYAVLQRDLKEVQVKRFAPQDPDSIYHKICYQLLDQVQGEFRKCVAYSMERKWPIWVPDHESISQEHRVMLNQLWVDLTGGQGQFRIKKKMDGSYFKGEIDGFEEMVHAMNAKLLQTQEGRELLLKLVHNPKHSVTVKPHSEEKSREFEKVRFGESGLMQSDQKRGSGSDAVIVLPHFMDDSECLGMDNSWRFSVKGIKPVDKRRSSGTSVADLPGMIKNFVRKGSSSSSGDSSDDEFESKFITEFSGGGYVLYPAYLRYASKLFQALNAMNGESYLKFDSDKDPSLLPWGTEEEKKTTLQSENSIRYAMGLKSRYNQKKFFRPEVERQMKPMTDEFEFGNDNPLYS